MNKQEAIKKVEQMGEYERFVDESIPKLSVLNILNQLDEPQKPVIPQFVADYIDISKFYVRTLHYALENSPEKVKLWLCEDEKNRQEIFARAWLDGYEVEEKRYTVKIKAVDQYLVSAKDENFLGFLTSKLRTYFTRKELEEAGFGWVFDCLGMEVEEVE